MQFTDSDTKMSGSISGVVPLAALLFERNGDMNLVILDKTNPEDEASVKLVSDYFQYALSRNDWMDAYAKVILPDKKSKKPFLRLVKSDKRDIN
jgi:hypothetical protein